MFPNEEWIISFTTNTRPYLSANDVDSVSLFVSNLAEKVLKGFSRNFHGKWRMGHKTTNLDIMMMVILVEVAVFECFS